MLERANYCASVIMLLAVSASAGAQSIAPPSIDDHTIVYELGWAAEWSHAENAHLRGVTFAVEVTPIDDWLEIEIGVSAIHSDGTTEIPIDVLFKKPWTVSPQFEVMAGIGPELIHAGADSATYWGVSSVLDLMFWPRKNVGWYLEPGYEVTFRNGAHHGAAMAAGLIIGR